MTFSRSKSGSALTRPPRQAWVLEPRMMFDAAAVATVADVAAHVAVAATDTAPGVDATPVKATVTVTDTSSSFEPIDLFSGVSVSADKDGQELKELVITVNRSGANQAIVIDGTEITLEAANGARTTEGVGKYGYTVAVSGATTTITVSIDSSDAFQPSDVATLIEGMTYRPLDKTVAGGDVTVTLKSLSDESDTAELNIHATVTIDSKINVAPELSGGTLQEAEAFTAGTLAKATEIAYSSDGSHVYAAGGNNTITVFAVDSSGRLTQQQNLVVENLGTVNHLVVSADGKSVYTVSSNGNLIHLSVNDGTLAYVSTTTLEGGGSTGGLAISDDGKQIYVDASSNSGREVYVYNRNADGVLTQIQKLEAHRNGAITTSGDYVYVLHSGAMFSAPHELRVYQRDPTTGSLTLLDDLLLTQKGSSAVDYALASSKDGKLLYVGDPTNANIAIYRLGSDNRLTLVDTVTSDKTGSLTLNSDGSLLYAATTTGTVNVYAVGENGRLTLTGSRTGTTNGGDIAVSVDGNSILVAGNGISRYSPIQTLLRGGEITLAHGLTLSDANNDQLAEGNGDYNDTTLTISRAPSVQADDQFGFAEGNGLQRVDGTIMKGDTVIATFSQSAGALTLTFLAGASKADANAVLHQITYSNTGTDTNGTIVKLALQANDGKANSQTVSLDVLITNNTAPTLEATSVGTHTYDTHGIVTNPFSNSIISAGEIGQSIIELTLTIDGVDEAANEFIIISGTRINLASDSSGQAGDYHYTYSRNYGTGTLVINHETGVTATAAQTLVNGIAYVNDTEQATTGVRTITLNSLRDNGGTAGEGKDTGELAISATIALAINNAPGWQNTVTDPNATLYYNNNTLNGYSEYVTDIVVSPDGKTLLISGSDGANASGNSTLRIYSRNSATGELTLVQTFIQGKSENSETTAIEANGLQGISTMVMQGNDLYVAGHSGDAATYSLVRFTYDATTGQYRYAGMVATQGVGGVTGLDAQITEIVISDDGKSLYTINGLTTVDGSTGKSVLAQFARDPNTGALTYLGAYQGGSAALGMNAPSGLVISGDGKSVYVANSSSSMITVLSRDVETGKLAYIGLINDASISADANSGARPSDNRYLTNLQNITLSPDDNFVYVGSGQQATLSIFSRNASDGSLTYVGTVDLYNQGYTPSNALSVRELVISQDGTALYAGMNGGSVLVFSRDVLTGALTYVGALNTGARTNHIVASPDGLNLYSGRSSGSTGLAILSALPNATYTTNGPSTFAEGLGFADVDADQKSDYQGTTLTVNRVSGASADDQFGFKNGSGLRLEDGKVMKGKATIATFATQEGVLTITFSRDVDKATANQVLQQVTYLNSNTAPPAQVDLSIRVRDSEGKFADTAVALLLAAIPVTPTLDAESKQASATITTSGLPGTVDLFDNVDARLGKAGAALSELTFTINRSSADDALIIDGTTIPLTATDAAGLTVKGHQYQVTTNEGVTTITLKLHSGDNTPSDVNALIDSIGYKVLSNDVAEGAVTITLTQLVDADDNTTSLDIHSTVTVSDTRLMPQLGAETGALDYGELFDVKDDKGNSLFIGIQGITVVGEKIYVVRTHSDSVYNEETETSTDVTYNTLSVLQRGEDGKLYLSDSVEITGLTDATQIRASSDGSSLYVIGAESIVLINASDLNVIGAFGNDIGMVRDVLVNDNKVYITTGESLLVFTRDGNTLTLSKTFTDGDSSGLELDAANALALSPDGKSLFVATSGGDTVVSRFSIGEDGTLTFRQAVAGKSIGEDGYYTSALSVSPDGKSLYAVDNNSLLHVFSVAQDGTLTAVSTLTIGEGSTSVKQVLVSPDGKSVVITGELGNSENYNTYGIILYARDADGNLTQLQAVDGFGDLANFNGTRLNEVRQVAFSADGKQLYITGSVAYGSPEGVIVLDLKPASVTFTENSSPVALLPSGTLSAPVNDQGSYQGASIAIERVGGSEMGDEFGVSSDSGLSFKDNQVWQGDKAIADVTTAPNGTFTITFLTGISQVEAQQVLRAITYHSTSNDPTKAGDKATFRITFNDGQSHTAEFTMAVALVDLNNAAVVSTEPVNSTYAPGSDAVNLFKNTVIDTIEQGQKINRVDITVSPAGVGDVLHVDGGEISLDKSIDYQVFVGKSQIEYRVSVSNGVATVNLYVTRDGASAAQVIDGITYSHSKTDVAGNRTIGLAVYEDVDWKHPEPQNSVTEFSEKAIITFQGSEAPENSAPVYNDNAGLNLGQLQAGTAYRYTLPENLFTDADSDSLTWRVSGLPDGLSFDAATRTISGTPTASGDFTVALTASDGKAEATHTVKVTVDQAPDIEPENSAPVYNDNAGLNLGQLQAGTEYRYTLPENLFTDADSDSLTWHVSGLPDGLSFDAATRTISGTPTASGDFTVVLTASDSKAEATHTVKVTVDQAPDVEPENSSPVYNDNAGLNLGQLQAGTEYHYTLPENLFTDSDNDSLTWRVIGLPNGLSFDAATRTISGKPTASGDFTVVLMASDGKAEVTHSVKVMVTQAPDVDPQPEIPDNTNTATAAPVILVQQSASLPVDASEREREQPLNAIVADLSRSETQSSPTNPLIEPMRQRDADTVRQSDAPWVLDPVMSQLMPTLEQVNFSSRASTAVRDSSPASLADSNLFLSVRGQTTSLESAFSSVQGALQPDASGALTFSLPQRMFSVREGNATLTLQLANGRPLPAWVQFDARSGVVRITDASAVQVNQIQLVLKAQAADGTSRTVPITLQTGQGDGAAMAIDRGAMQLPSHATQNDDVEPLAPTGKTAFTEQLRQHQPEQDALLAALSELSSLRA
ncbi:beta-propeller fold lactonase family protein [Pectobacterium punjabense]|uniref:beta-propeller fold lactonase family protein n=1 Tax=Pectobacterium punjabense TaxID=2108399 RepID=UPI0032F030FD